MLAFDAAIAIDPSYLKAHLKRARILFERSEYRAALTSIHLLIESKELKGRTLESIQGMFESCMGHIGAQLEFGVVDLKLTTDGQVKILEYGPGFASGLGGYDIHHRSNPIRDKLINLLTRFQLPFYIAHAPGINPPHSKLFEDTGVLGDWTEKPSFDPSQLSSYRGIYAGHQVPTLPLDVMALNSQGVTNLALDDKTHFTRALKEVAPEARPMSFIIKKKASEMELMRIQAQL